MNRNLQIAALLVSSTLAAVAQNGNTKLYRSGNEWVQEEVHGTLSPAKMVRIKSTRARFACRGRQNSINYVIRELVRAGSEDAARREIGRMHFTAQTPARW